MGEPPRCTFTVTLVDPGAIPIEFDQRAVFGRARPAVVVEIGGYSYRSTIAVMNGRTFVPLRRSHREAAGIGAGDTVTVTLTLDTAPRTVAPLPALAAALAAAGVRDGWDRLSPTAQREANDAIAAAKRPETRSKRLAAAVALAAARA